MKILLTPVAAILVALAVAPASAQPVAPGAAAAIAHFNQDADGQDDRVRLPTGASGPATLSTRSGDLATVYGRFNADADRPSDATGLVGATPYGGKPTFGREIFESLAAED